LFNTATGGPDAARVCPLTLKGLVLFSTATGGPDATRICRLILTGVSPRSSGFEPNATSSPSPNPSPSVSALKGFKPRTRSSLYLHARQWQPGECEGWLDRRNAWRHCEIA